MDGVTPYSKRKQNAGRTVLLVTSWSLMLWGCIAQPQITRTIYEDRSVWVRLEKDPTLKDDRSLLVEDLPITSSMLTNWMRGFRVETDRGPIGMMMGRPGDVTAFVDPELAMLTPHLAKALQTAGPQERVAYCTTVDYSPTERFITTGWVYVRRPYLHFNLVEYRTPVQVASPAVPTAEACRTKPIPGTKTADRFFQMDYKPSEVVVKFGLTSGLMAGADRNSRGEMVFKLSQVLAGITSEKARKETQEAGSAAGSALKSPEGNGPSSETPLRGRE